MDNRARRTGPWEAPAVDARGREVQLVFGLKEEHFGSDLHDGRRLDGHGDGEQSQLRSGTAAAFHLEVLTVEILQPSLKLQSLTGKKPQLFGRFRFFSFSEVGLTRKPEELSRRQRKRQTKLLSRKDEFSGGSWSGLYMTVAP